MLMVVYFMIFDDFSLDTEEEYQGNIEIPQIAITGKLLTKDSLQNVLNFCPITNQQNHYILRKRGGKQIIIQFPENLVTKEILQTMFNENVYITGNFKNNLEIAQYEKNTAAISATATSNALEDIQSCDVFLVDAITYQ